jgi:hypothetical protein
MYCRVSSRPSPFSSWICLTISNASVVFIFNSFCLTMSLLSDKTRTWSTSSFAGDAFNWLAVAECHLWHLFGTLGLHTLLLGLKIYLLHPGRCSASIHKSDQH